MEVPLLAALWKVAHGMVWDDLLRLVSQQSGASWEKIKQLPRHWFFFSGCVVFVFSGWFFYLPP